MSEGYPSPLDTMTSNAYLRVMDDRTRGNEMDVTMTVDGVSFTARPEFGGWYETDDPTPSGSVGRLYIPMLFDGSAATDEPVEIEVAYEDA